MLVGGENMNKINAEFGKMMVVHEQVSTAIKELLINGYTICGSFMCFEIVSHMLEQHNVTYKDDFVDCYIEVVK